ncbi:DUF2264 domain-containing protein [Marinimicrobium alkaliphilum]|uniref:DUF2264 domain-containing protein n=1 Tax=Marinimicrobium alkaliphilum TaxID=2202654 RepID=UPI0018E08BAF|nr:DUF2264 domain-containing protein [Marinimicrobium alkaliphilum]
MNMKSRIPSVGLGRIAFGFLVLSAVVMAACTGPAKTETSPEHTIFTLEQPDYELSPHTGMTREHWKDATRYLLEGAFSYIDSIDDPMVFPFDPGMERNERRPEVTVVEKLEGLSRTLFGASVLLKEDPDLEINGIKLADYYRHHLAELINPESPTYIEPRAEDGGPNQALVEFGAVAISLFVAPEVLWEPLSKAQQDALADTMLSYGDGPTVPSNWKFFNIYVLSFFKTQGYEVNEALLVEYLQESLEHYRGDGWYNDNPAYDYYSMWAFQMYGILWADLFGNQHYPDIAKQFADYFEDLNDNYPYLFSRDGEMIMWGRSIGYRFASITPFPLMGLNEDPDINYGWMRRISSGNLLQFLQHPDFLHDGVPTLGFYGTFEPAVQGYSVRGSNYWSLKAFLALLIPEDNAFWTATENEGAWESHLTKGTVHNNFQAGAEILTTNYPNIGASEVRAWCHVGVIDNWEAFRGSENYNRLAYNSAFPWQADGAEGEVAMNYVIRNKDDDWEALRLFEFEQYSDGVYYRSAVLETDDNVRLKLADIPLPNGILRVDENLSTTPTEFRLGHYALPRLGNNIRKSQRTVNGYEVQIIDNGVYQLAMVPLRGWQDMDTLDTTGLHPASDQSAVINVSHTLSENSRLPVIYATLMLWKESGEPWTDDELMPVARIDRSSEENNIVVLFRDGNEKTLWK